MYHKKSKQLSWLSQKGCPSGHSNVNIIICKTLQDTQHGGPEDPDDSDDSTQRTVQIRRGVRSLRPSTDK